MISTLMKPVRAFLCLLDFIFNLVGGGCGRTGQWTPDALFLSHLTAKTERPDLPI